MIIKNNYNKKNVDPLSDYNNIGKGSHSLDKQFEMENQGFITDNLNNEVIQDIINSDNEYQEDDDEDKDKWDFFK